MPLFMDIHLNSDLNLEEVAKLHKADLAVQSKYGVHYQRYWVNEEMGTVFCLMEGPDKESCKAVHKESHGQMACNIIEVQPGDYQHYLGQFDHTVKDRAFIRNNKPDTGFRTFVHVDFIINSNHYYNNPIKRLKQYANNFEGTVVENAREGVQCVFTSCSQAIKFALVLQKEFKKSETRTNSAALPFVECRIGISAGDPVEEHNKQYFSGALSLAKRLSEVTKPGQIMISKSVWNCLINEGSSDSYLQVTRVVDLQEEKFLTKLMKVTDDNLGFNDFNVQSLGRHIGLSRPQLYRKITRLTGLSPKHFIREQRLKNAVSLIKNRSGNISEIAFEVGYNSPSYFSKCFQDRFGSLPSNL